MGSPETEVGKDALKASYQSNGLNYSETQHQVTVSDFYMGKYEVSVGEFRKFVEATNYKTDAEKEGFSIIYSDGELTQGDGTNWRYGVSGKVRPKSEENHPVVHVSWNDAVEYCRWLSEKTGKSYRLPTEAEWEYACRAGSSTPFNTGENVTTSQANYNGNYPYSNYPKGECRQNTVPVDSFAPNAWGLYNMHGNVFEWCSDWYSGRYYDECKAKRYGDRPCGTSNGFVPGDSWRRLVRSCRGPAVSELWHLHPRRPDQLPWLPPGLDAVV
jgi:formylglycine-generating enzyme